MLALLQAVVLLVHGLMSLRDKVRFPEIAAALAERGVSSLRFDFTGNGDSGGDFCYANSFGEVGEAPASPLRLLWRPGGRSVLGVHILCQATTAP